MFNDSYPLDWIHDIKILVPLTESYEGPDRVTVYFLTLFLEANKQAISYENRKPLKWKRFIFLFRNIIKNAMVNKEEKDDRKWNEKFVDRSFRN